MMTRDSAGTDDDRAREITVPLRIYKAITVFSTLLAIVFVVFGFGLLDAATAATGPLAVLFEFIGIPGVGGGAFSVVLALIGLAVIGFGAGTYVLGTRFRSPGMGKDKDDGDESFTNE